LGLAGAPAEDLGQEGFAHPGIADDHDAGALLQKVEVEQVEDAVLGLQARFVMGEVKLVEGGSGGKPGELEATLDSTAVAGFQLQVGQALQSGGKAKILGGGLTADRLQGLSHSRQAQLAQFFFQGHGQETPFGLAR